MNKYSKSIIFLCVVILFSCSTNDKIKATSFDKIIHYQYVGTKNFSILDKDSTFTNNTLEKEYIIGEKPTKYHDAVYTDLSKIGFTKREIDKKKINAIINILRQNDSSKLINTCIPHYRDILLFTAKNKIIDVVKVCFECNEVKINELSSFQNLKDNQAINYSKLKVLLSD